MDDATPFRVYLAAVARHWWALMSSAVFTLFTIAALIWNPNNSWLLIGNLLLAAVCLLAASYRAWEDEHRLSASLAPRPKLSIHFKGGSLLHRRVQDGRTLHRVSILNSSSRTAGEVIGGFEALK